MKYVHKREPLTNMTKCGIPLNKNEHAGLWRLVNCPFCLSKMSDQAANYSSYKSRLIPSTKPPVKVEEIDMAKLRRRFMRDPVASLHDFLEDDGRATVGLRGFK